MAGSSAGFELILDIEGMTCASCVYRIEKVLRRQACVEEATVSLASRSAVVRSTVSDPQPLIEAVRKAGYGASLRDRQADRPDEVADYQRRLLVSAVCSFYVLLFSLVLAKGSHASAVVAWLLATPVQFYGGWPFLRTAARAARHGTHTMDTLIAAGSLAAYGYSLAAVLSGGHHVYFDTAAMIITLVLLGKVLEARARAKAGDATRLLLEKQATEATLLEDGAERRVSVRDLRPGHRVVVLPGETFPADGTVSSGRSSIDLSMITGESLPVDVEPGDEVVGGSLNGPGRVVVALTRVGDETRLAQIVRLLERTQASKAPIQRVADRVAAAFVPRVIALALLTTFVRYFFDTTGVGEALMYGAAVLLVACPCSLGLATPAAILAGTGRAAELGILFKGGEVFEAARRIDVVLFDKTGTLTRGEMSVQEVVALAGTEVAEVLGLAAAAESGSEHPIARAVLRRAAELGVSVPESSGHRAEPGAGIEAIVQGSAVRVGRPDGLPAEVAERADRLAARGLTLFSVSKEGIVIGLIGVADTLKPNAGDAVRRLRTWGLDAGVVSGDRRATVEAVAVEVGIDHAVWEVFPEGKVEEIRRLQAAGKRVAFVGDGINDAPALAQADLGIALRTGTDVAREAGDVLVMGSDIGLVVDCLVLARKTYWVIWQNLAWAFAYNGLMIPLAAVGVVSPLVAAGAMAGSSVTVVANALRLRTYARYREPERSESGSEPSELQGVLERLRAAAESEALAVPASKPGPSVEHPDVAEAEDPSPPRPGAGLLRDTLAHLADSVIRRWGEQWDA